VHESLIKIRSRIADTLRRYCGYPVVLDAFKRGSDSRRRALLVYMVEPFADPWRREHLVRRYHIAWRVQEIASVLDGMGFCVDVVQWVDERFVPTAPYDLLVGTGSANMRLAGLMTDHCKKVGLATGCEAGFNNRAEERRLKDLHGRRGRQLAPRRLAPVYSESLRVFDALGVMGNRSTVDTFAPFHSRIYAFNNHRGDEMRWCDRDLEQARRHFLYVASWGQVHRGLDLLLETFARLPSCHLHVCGPVEREGDFFDCYRHELRNVPNIHVEGFIQIPSARFFDLCSRCAAVVLPSCAEGQSGAVVAAMHTGLVPVISRETGIDVGDFGVLLPDCTLDTIGREVERMAGRPPDELLTRTRRVRAVARKSFSTTAFTERFTHMLTEIVSTT